MRRGWPYRHDERHGPPIPPEVWVRIVEFLDAAKTGSITLDVKDGHVLSYKLIEAGRVHEPLDTSCASG